MNNRIDDTSTTLARLVVCEQHPPGDRITFAALCQYVHAKHGRHALIADQHRQRIASRLTQPGIIELDPDAEGYIQKPLDWAPTPQSFCRRLFDDETIKKHLTALTNRQKDDGGWPISWEAISPAVEAEWRGRFTIEVLRTLDAYQKEG